MGSLLTPAEASAPHEIAANARVSFWGLKVRGYPADTLAMTLALGAVPISIAVSEFFLAIALVARLARCVRREVEVRLPRIFWFWLAWAGLETASWLLSPLAPKEWGEMRRLFLIASLFLVCPALCRARDALHAWQAVFLSSAIGCIFLIRDFCFRLAIYQREIQAGGHVSSFLRTGGLLHHWMVFGTVEVVVVAGLLSFWIQFPKERLRWGPVVALNAVAIILSLTRTVWVVALLLLGIALAWRRSRWVWALPFLPLMVFLFAPAAVRSRVRESVRLDYPTNTQRVEMLRVGWRMIEQHPLIGVGPGGVEKRYQDFLLPGEPLPAYHGHLHNNLVQLAAEFGLPTAAAAVLFVVVVFRELLRALSRARTREEEFSCRAAILGLTGYLTAGFFDYTYGHSLGLILLAFCVLTPLVADHRPEQTTQSYNMS